MQVEEDPSSQFVDFTNATASEQFVSDVEQALIAWQLSHKGHASLDALAAAFPNSSCAPKSSNAAELTSWTRLHGGSDGHSVNEPAIWTHSLEFRPSDAHSTKHYALTLFVSRQGQHPKQELAPPSGVDTAASGTNSRSRMLKKWQEGLEHFTPTMLSVADAGRDFQWGVSAEDATTGATSASEAESSTTEFLEEVEGAPSSSGGRASAYYTSVFEDDQEAMFSRKAAFQNVQKWFGVDEFLLLTPSSPPQTNAMQQEGSPVSNLTSRQANRAMKKLPSDTGSTDENGDTEDQGDGDTEDKVEKNVSEVNKGAKEGDDGDAEVSSSATGDDDGMADIPVDQNESGMLLSALTIALNNCNCTIPAFVPVLEPSRGTWVGSAVPGATGNVSISFDTDSVPELNPNQSCISGLLDFFKLKLQLSPQVEEKCRLEAGESGDLAIGMMVSASFGYSWERAEDPRQELTPENPLEWRQFESQLPVNEQARVQQVTEKLFGEHHTTPLLGCTTSPLLGMELTASWPKLREGTYVDNVVHSTLDPNTAPEWMLEVRFQDLLAENQRKPQLPLSKRIANLVQVYSNSRELNKDILVSELAPSINYPPPSTSASASKSTITSSPAVSGIGGEATVTTSSTAIPESIPAARGAAVVLGHAIGSITSSLVSAATWKGTDVEEIRRIVVELFDEAELKEEDEESGRGSKSGGSDPPVTMPSSVMHGAPIGELVSILATRMSELHGINSMSLLWVEFVKALRDRWFQQRLLPFMRTTGDEGGASHNTSSRSLDALFLLDVEAVQLPPPDFRQCLLHQKLQLLNCCILRQAEVSKPGFASGDSNTDNGGSGEGGGDGSLSDDEFFDSMEHQEGTAPPSPPRRPERRSEGVLREVPGVVCLQTNEPLQDPVTQTAVPMTEDVAKQQQDLLTRLGVSVESVMLRQQIQSKALVSDMQAFKAANPRGCLTDFIRWYSPKDWISFESDETGMRPCDLPIEGRGIWWFEGHGMLSERMRFGPDRQHLWQQMWETSAPVPASRQKPLFDPLQESEKVYHYLETLSPHELFHQMLAGAISSNIFALETALPIPVTANTLPVVHRALQGLRSRGSRAIALLDEALAESQVAFPAAGRSRCRHEDDQKQQSLAAAHQGQQLQVAFEMALDACWKLVRALEVVEALVSKALALLQYFPAPQCDRGALELVNLLLQPTLSRRQQSELAATLKRDDLHQRISALVLTNPTLAGAGPMSVPVQREYVLRCICPRPFLREYFGDLTLHNGEEEPEDSALRQEESMEESPLVVNRMYAAFKKSTVRFALTLAESEF